MSEEFADNWVEIRRYHAQEEAQHHALVLVAMGISCQLVPHGPDIALLVLASEVGAAQYQIAAYERENRRPRRTASPIRALGDGVDAVLVYCAALVFVEAAAGRGAFSQDWWMAGRAQAGLILDGEWWRTLTALGLHADFGHFIGNLSIGSLFGLMLSQLLGPGLAWLAILIGGGIGNGINALVQPPSHTAVGASTAVFAALGLLAVLMSKHQTADWRGGLRRWLPLAAGAALLAMLGAGGERTDVGAHIFGFMTGCLLGAGLHFGRRRLPRGRSAQYGYGAAALGLFVFAWVLAF